MMLRFGKTKVAKEGRYDAKKVLKVWDIYVDDIIISKLVETKDKSKYLIGYLNVIIKPLRLMLPEMSGYAKTFKDKG